MTFRIDSVVKEPEGVWSCGFKGVFGKGVYGRLMTNADGGGLYLKEQPEGDPIALLPPTQFQIPPNLGDAFARERFAAVLWFLDWGPEIREYRDGP